MITSTKKHQLEFGSTLLKEIYIHIEQYICSVDNFDSTFIGK